MKSSIFHFFAHLMERRGYFVQENKLGDFDFPKDMVAAESKGTFPDFVLKINRNGLFDGGELIELKDAKSYTITSFNSTIPSAKKRIDQLAMNIQNKLFDTNQAKDFNEVRDVYYLIRGIKKSASYPLSKTILVSGAFFETVSSEDVLQDAFSQVAAEAMPKELDHRNLIENLRVRQSAFAATRKVEKSSISVRFRVMAQVDPHADLLKNDRYPMIGDNTLTFLHYESSDKQTEHDFYPWDSAPQHIKQCKGYTLLDQAYDDINASLKMHTRVSILSHPLNGPFFMAQANIHP